MGLSTTYTKAETDFLLQQVGNLDGKSEIVYGDLKSVNSQAVEKYAVKKINTIADLRNTVGDYEGQVVVLMGYYEAGDKEPLNYKWTLTQGVDNGGTVINSSKGSWKAILGDIVDVKHFGAKGDGITDDTLPIKKAIETLKKILFSKGTYNISDVLEITKSGYLIDGDNATIKATSLIFSVFKIYKTTENIGDTTIKNIFIECNNRADYGIHCTDYKYNNIIDAVSIYHSKIHGISLSLNCWINTIQNCRIYYAGSSGIYCGNNANSVGIINNEIGVCNIGIELNAATVSTNGLYLQRNTIQSCINSGISVLGFMNAVSIIGNYLEDNEVYGINTEGDSTGTSIIGNTIHGKTNVSVYLIKLNAKTATVQGNVLSNGVTSKIYVHPNAHAVIIGNRLGDSNSPLVNSYLNDSYILETTYNDIVKINGRRISLSKYTIAPTSGTFKKGDIVYSADPDNGEAFGWVCTVGNIGETPAVFQPFGIIGLTKSSAVANVSSVNATDLATALTLVNELKAKLNAKLTADRDSGQQAT